MSKMSVFGHYVPSSKSEDLHQQIYKNHLVYLGQEDSPAKIAKWNNLEGLIAEYLALVPHKKKFVCPEVTAALHRSVTELPNFSALKAALVFQTLEKYATNLLSHPWRKEHTAIKLYSGFYKNLVENNLLGAESILYLMGYNQQKDLVLMLEEPVDPDGVAKVALDCLVAYVECQIMIQIWEKIQPSQISWADIHQIREDYICSIEEAVRLLHQMKRAINEKPKSCRENYVWNTNNFTEREYKPPPEKLPPKTRNDLLLDIAGVSNKRPSQTCDPHTGGRLQFDGLTITRSKSPSWTEGLSASQDRISQIRNNFCSWENDADSFPPQDSYWNSPLPTYDYPSYSSARMPSDESWDLLHTPIRNQHSSFSYCHPQEFVRNHQPSFYSKPPYAVHYGSNHCAPASQFSETCPCRFYHHPPQPPVSSIGLLPHHYSFGDAMLHSSNYRNPKQSEAQASLELDCLMDSFQHISMDRPVNIKEEPKAPPNLIAPKPKKITNNEASSLLMQDSPPQTRKRGSIYDNVTSVENERTSEPSPPPPKKEVEAAKITKKVMPKPVDTVDCAIKPSYEKPTKTKLELIGKNIPVEVKDYNEKVLKPAELLAVKTNGISVRWSCSFCTFINEPKNDVCEMCSRSRHPGSESTPLVSGGRECPHCTLVNDKSATCCIACEASLKDSPTYI